MQIIEEDSLSEKNDKDFDQSPVEHSTPDPEEGAQVDAKEVVSTTECAEEIEGGEDGDSTNREELCKNMDNTSKPEEVEEDGKEAEQEEDAVKEVADVADKTTVAVAGEDSEVEPGVTCESTDIKPDDVESPVIKSADSEIDEDESVNTDAANNELVNTDAGNNESVNTDAGNNESVNTDAGNDESVSTDAITDFSTSETKGNDQILRDE